MSQHTSPFPTRNAQNVAQALESIRHLHSLLDHPINNKNEAVSTVLRLRLDDSYINHHVNQFKIAINKNKIEEAKQLARSIEKRIIEMQNQAKSTT